MTREERVDIEADNTRITTRAIISGDNPDSIVGMTESKPSTGTPASFTPISSVKRRPKPPRK